MSSSIETYKRREGSIWIDNNSPHDLKYYAYGKEYVVSPTATYEYTAEGSVGDVVLRAGTVVTLEGARQVKKAVFPDDLDKVVGVVETDVLKRREATSTVVVTHSGYIIIDNPKESFATLDDVKLSLDGRSGNFYTKETIIGAPVYWFIGRIEHKTSNYTYLSPADVDSYAGKLTLATPAGFPEATNVHSSLNVSYDNLPQIGSVAGVEVGENNELKSVVIHLNFSNFDSSLEWSWPCRHSTSQEEVCGKINPYNPETGKITPYELTIRHGLFPPSAVSMFTLEPSQSRCRCFVDVTASPENEDGSADRSVEYAISTAISNSYETPSSSTEEEKKNCTKILIETPETLYYRVSGRVNYKFDKNHN